MNKKLFSWKALAGLALLVAVGLTSCKQGTEVDPNDPYNTKTPTQPGTSTKGGDLVFTITKTADLASLWASYDATKKAELMKKTTLNIVINSGSYKLDGATLQLPKFFNTTANSVLNLTFNGSFQDADKQPLVLDASTNLSGAKVNIVVPGQAFNMTLDAANVAATLASEGAATIGTFKATANANKNNALSINNGVTVNGIDDTATGAIVTNGGAIKALILNGTPAAANFVSKKGFKIGSGESHATSLIINAAGISVTNDKDTPLGDITINKNCDLTLAFVGAKANSITGTKASESKVTFANTVDATTGAITYSNDALKNVGSFKNVTVTNNGGNFNVEGTTLEGAKIDDNAIVKTTSLSGVEFGKNVRINFTANNVTYAFADVKFPPYETPNWYQLSVAGGIEKATTPTKVTYQWDINTKTWVKVTAAAPITAANAGDSGIEVSSNDVAVDNTGAITKGADKIGDHKVFTIVTGESVMLQPENCAITFDSKCTFGGAAITDTNINSLIQSWAVGGVDPTWFTVKVGNDSYNWKKGSAWWILVKE